MLRLRTYIVFLLVILAPAGALLAQIGTGQVNGTVTDPQGASIPSATATLVNQATNMSTQVKTNQRGYYLFANVQPGTYKLSIENTGFKEARIEPITVGVNQTVTQDVVLTLGQLNESVTVTSESELIQQASAELGSVIASKPVADLPLNGRNFTMLLTLTPGATPINVAQASSIGTGNDGSTTGIPGSAFTMPSVQGQWNRSVTYYMDGIINTDFRVSTYGLLPNPDLVQEFVVQSHNDKVEYGGVMGGVVNLISKTGSNGFHGSAFEFVRNNDFDARDPFKDATSGGPAPFHQNQFGATIGGRIIRDKTFFYGGYDGWRYSKPSQSFAYYPTDAELSGDFSHSIINHVIYDPATTTTDASGNYVRTPFAGNIIPGSRISSMVQGFFKAYSEVPNLTGNPVYNFILNKALTNNANNFQVKVDHRLTHSDNLFFRYSRMFMSNLQPGGYKTTDNSHVDAYNFGGGWTHVFRANLILDVRGGTNDRYFDDHTDSTVGLGPMKQLGFTDVDRFNGMTLSLLAPWTGAGFSGPQPRSNPVWNIAGNVTWSKGSHTLKGGYQWINVERLQITNGSTFNFNNDVTANPQFLGTTGASLASALVGLPYQYTGNLPDQAKVNFTLANWSAYVQDEWKVSPTLTVNFGTRFDYVTPATLHQIAGQAGQDLARGVYLIGAKTMPPPCSQAGVAPCIPAAAAADVAAGRIVLANPAVFMPHPVKNNWGPRASIAWRVQPKTVVRAGYGLFWDAITARSQYTQHNSEARWPWTTGFDSGLLNGIGAAPKTVQQIQGTFGAVLPADTPWTFVGWTNNPNRTDAYSHQWNVEIQRQVNESLMMSVAYVGSANRQLDYTGLGNSAKTPGPGTPDQVTSRRPVPFMGGGIFYADSIGTGNYHAFQFKADRRFAKGLSAILSYTWSKSIDTGSSGWFGAENGGDSGGAIQDYFHPNTNRSVSSYNVPHFLSLSSVYELPVGKGKQWLNTGPASYVLGNWQANMVMQFRSGHPYNLSVTGDVANIGNDVSWWNYARPNLVGNPTESHPTVNAWYNVSAFADPHNTYGNFGRNVLSTAHAFNTDFSVFKTIPIKGESQTVQLRFEAFNIFNVMNYAAPGTVVDQPGAGVVTGVDLPPRQLQFGFRYIF